ncbi:hypothetical protein B0T10DRAFT_179978 [Thelonectria olida]|uniref:Uncharacterized protein n=1 Tax=Thelonectria olida TaxID=1576542 RepID=A0A9P9AVJ8_9HYPO|nr:hypothetical protein B0T10DRAFT_179978 [Thelonectria olida]
MPINPAIRTRAKKRRGPSCLHRDSSAGGVASSVVDRTIRRPCRSQASAHQGYIVSPPCLMLCCYSFTLLLSAPLISTPLALSISSCTAHIHQLGRVLKRWSLHQPDPVKLALCWAGPLALCVSGIAPPRSPLMHLSGRSATDRLRFYPAVLFSSTARSSLPTALLSSLPSSSTTTTLAIGPIGHVQAHHPGDR